MIMQRTPAETASMGPTLAATEASAPAAEPRVTRLLGDRLELVEDLWQTVLRSECPAPQAERLLRMKALSNRIDGGAPDQASEAATEEIVQLIRDMDLAEAIAAARSFSLYFQLVNILEQHIEEDSYLASLRPHHAEELSDPFVPPLASQSSPATFRELFTRLRGLGVPPAQIEQLLQELDIRLVFTAHPTEIVRHTVRHKQRRVASLIQQLQKSQLLHPEERDNLRQQLEEEIRLWWRTDELHQFKPSVLDEVDYALHYFQQVLFEAMPQLRQRIRTALGANYPDVLPPSDAFCTFGSWVGSDRDGNPSVTPDITWRTASYQRQLMLDRYLAAVEDLRDQLSISMQWSQVSAPLLESLEMDRLRFPEVYEERAARYRLEPYRLKISYVIERLRLTLARNQQQAAAGWDAPHEPRPAQPDFGNQGAMPAPPAPELHYGTVDEFRTDLELINESLQGSGLSCEPLDNLIAQV
ncbi:MAG: phosphoenolpyruvate carboxylase, partial [Vulcanococcus sp.]